MVVLYLIVVVIAAGLLIFLVALVLRFTTQKEPLRSRSGKTAWVLACVIVAAWAVVFVCFRLFFGPPPPTVAELARSFPRQRQNLEQIIDMSDQDAEYSRIAPDFVWKFASPNQHVVTSDVATLPAVRWDQYRRIYKASRIDLGVSRNMAGDVFIMVASEGLLNRGHASGYLFCQPHPAQHDEPKRRFEPCTGTAASGAHIADGSSEGYEFQQLAEHWFAFDQGPG